MNDSPKRGGALMTLAILFGVLAVSDALKPVHMGGARTGLVFFGTRLTGTPNAILGPLFGIFLAVYAIGIWRMRRYALYFAYTYAIYVAINLFMFGVKNPQTNPNERAFGLVYIVIALGCSWGTAILLTRRRAELT